VRLAVLVGELAAERKIEESIRDIVVRQVCGRHPSEPCGRGLPASVQSPAIGAQILEYARPPVFAHALMHDEIQVYVQTAGMRDSDEARQRSLRSVTSLETALLFLAPEIARVEQAIAVASAPAPPCALLVGGSWIAVKPARRSETA